MVGGLRASRLSFIQLIVNLVSQVIGEFTPCISFVVLLLL